ncbi:MAG: T9SS type A sorting domain-containing protein [Bacteroidetes bacterium]|nr:T9SS type A sorting domain-containing protein [Bacteroidota bacterium]
MKTILIHLSFLLTLSLNAQYTITSTSNPVPGDIEATVYTYTTGLNQPVTGTNKLWNYSGISVNLTSTSSGTYVPISTVPNNNLFPGATIAVDQGFQNYDVYKINSSTRDELGFASPTATNCLVLNNPITLFTLPFAYGSSYYDTFGFNITGETLTGTLTTIADGTGTLVLPGFTLTNVVMVSTNYTEVDVTPTTTITTAGLQHLFYSNVSKFPLFSISTSTNIQNSVSSISTDAYVNKNFSMPVGIKEITDENNFSIYPNPVNKETVFINFTNKENKEISITLLNTLGQVIKENKYENLSSGENKLSLDLKNIPPGIHSLQINSGGIESVKKLVIE